MGTRTWCTSGRTAFRPLLGGTRRPTGALRVSCGVIAEVGGHHGGKLETGRAPLGAASTSHSPLSSFNSSLLPTGPFGTGPSWTAGAKTDQASSSNSPGMARGLEEKGGDPRTYHSLCMNACASADSPHPGGLATQTATPVSPASTDLGVSTAFSRDSEVRDECPSSAEVSVHPDGLTTILQDPDHHDAFPSSAESSDHRDGFPRAGVMEYSDTVFLRDFHADENSERVRQSDSGVQIVPASRSPSELSAHQMGLSLAGTDRLKSEPIGVDPTGTLDIGESVQLSISDRALLRKYKSSEQVKENSQQTGTYKQEISASVSRVDGHPPEQSLGLYDRMLLRKYPDAGTKTTFSHSSTLVSSPPVAYPGESVKKRRRFYQKGNSNRANTRAVARNENSQGQESSPCGFPSKVAEPPVHSGCIISPSALTSEPSDFALLYYTLAGRRVACWIFTRVHVLGNTSTSSCEQVANFGGISLRLDGFHGSGCTSSRI